MIGLGRYFHKIWCKITWFWCTKPLSGNCQVGVFRPFLQRSLVQFRKQLVFLSVIHVWTSNLFTFSLCPCDSKMIEYELLNLISSRKSIQLNFTKIVNLWFWNRPGNRATLGLWRTYFYYCRIVGLVPVIPYPKKDNW